MRNEGGFRPRGGFTAPVKVGDELDVKIEAVGEKGDGIAKKNGFVLFVPNTNEGDEVKVRVTKVLRRVGFAEVVGKGEASEEASEEPATEEDEPKDEESASDEPEDKEPEEAEDTEKDTENFGEDLERE